MSLERTIPVRAPRFDFRAVPDHWLAEGPRATRLVNALSLLFPEGERFFIRSVKHYLGALEDEPELLAQVRGFFGQEGRHGHEHERFNRLLARHGLEPEVFLALYQRLGWDSVEPRVAPHLRLATTAALEHMTATLAELALDSPILDVCDPEMAAMLRWHACEEIEHKAVAFDVLQRVDPRMRTRLGGFAIGGAMLLFFWGLGVAHLARHEPGPDAPTGDAERRFFAEVRRNAGFLAGSLLDYLRPGFHPDQRDNYPLARAHLEALAASEPEAAQSRMRSSQRSL